jgi:ribose-phosphate pyrophosphokinase
LLRARDRLGRVESMMPAGELVLFALGASRAWAESVARELGIALGAHEERGFEDGEHKTRPLASVRDRDVYVIHSLYSDEEQSVNDKLVRLLFFIGAVRDAAAARITVVVPYLAYARKDRKTKSRDPVTTRYVAELLEAVGTDCVVTMDVHNLAAYQNAFRCRTEHLEAAPLFVAHLAPLLTGAEVAVVSPDVGGIKRAEAFRARLTATLGRPVGAAFAEKYRSAGTLSGEALVGDVGGKVAVIVDDLISAGNTVARAAKACSERGAARVVAAATHGVFAPAAAEVLGGSVLERVIVTDTIPLRIADARVAARIDRLGTAAYFAEAIRRLHQGGSLVELQGG